MTDFRIFHLGNWRAGEMPIQSDEITHTVSHDQRTYAYAIDNGDEADFVEWAALRWEAENDERGEGEDATAYMDRIGVDFRRIN